MKNVLILGGSGFIGTNIALKLLQEGHHVTILDRSLNNSSAFDVYKDTCTLVKVDILEFESVKKVIHKGDFSTAIHLITNVIPGSSFVEFLNDSDINIKTGFKLLDEIYRAGIKNYIYFSSGGTVYGNNGREVNQEDAPKNPISLYGWYKSAMEQYIQTFSHSNPINYAILRPSNPYGYFQNIYGKQGFIAVAMGKIVKNEELEIWGDGSIIRDYIFISDLADVVCLLIKKGFKNHVFNIGTGEGHSLNELLVILDEITNRKMKVTFTEHRGVDVTRNILDVSLIKDYLKLEKVGVTPIQEGIGKMWDWVCHQHGVQK